METVTEDSVVTEQDMMREAMELIVAGTRQPNEVTTNMVRGWFPDLGMRQAHMKLEKLLDEGLLKKRNVIEDGHNANAYSPVDGDWSDIVQQLK